jgi:hypothetical protein
MFVRLLVGGNSRVSYGQHQTCFALLEVSYPIPIVQPLAGEGCTNAGSSRLFVPEFLMTLVSTHTMKQGNSFQYDSPWRFSLQLIIHLPL